VRPRKLDILLLAAAALSGCASALADGPANPPPAETPVELPSPVAPQDAAAPARPGLLSDIEGYFTAPLHWDQTQWLWFGGAAAAVALAHRYDSQVRTHFVGGQSPGTATNTEDVHDAIPAAAVFGVTFVWANLAGDHDGRQEAWAMLEAGALSGVTAEALKYAVGRQGPDVTSNPNEWGHSGSSFPSLHSTAAFAIGTVLAESGNDDYRLLRRLLGYGVGVFTSYERLKHNAHWLSDTVAGATLGAASARYVMDRRYGSGSESHLALVPIEGGAMLTYNLTLP
jgi:membrane-associated phospholipid phosphatase